METILYTNNKREGSNYQVDRITYAQRIDTTQLIQNQMQKYSISRIHFWFLKDNINGIDNNKEDSFLISIGKHIMEKGHFKFQYVVQKYRHNQTNQKRSLLKEELIKQEIGFSHIRQYQQFIKNQLVRNIDPQIVKKYLFTNQEQSIAISIFQLHQKNLVLQLIEDQCNQAYNAKLNYRKISTIHPQNYEKKKIEHIQQPIQMYHKLILYLFYVPDKLQDTQIKRRKINKSNNANQMGIQALVSWKIKEDAQSLAKYQKQCELIKQQIENEKIIFRNKIKIIQNYIGDSINVQKLYMEQEQVSINNQLSNTMGSPTFKKVPQLTKRSSITPAINQAMTNNIQKLSKYNNTSNTLNSFLPVSEFKRLKDINQAMRNIDNTLFDQGKKIQQLRIKTKEMQKSKQELLFRQAKELNSIKRDLLDLGQEMERKQNEIQEKKRNGEFQTYIQYKNKQPSEKAKQTLKQHIQFLTNYQKPISEPQPIKHTHTHSKDVLLLKVRQKRLQQTQATLKKFQEVKEQKSLQKHQHFTSSARKLQRGSDKQQGQLADLPLVSNQLHHLYQYYLKNSKIIKTVIKEISNYKCLNQNQQKSHFKKSQIRSKNSQNVSTILNQGFQQFVNLQKFPILKSFLQFERTEDDCIPSFKHDKHKSQYIFENQYPRDCFELMISKQAETIKRSIRQKSDSLDSSLKDSEGDKKIEAISKAPSQQLNIKSNMHYKLWPKPSKFKRMTIDQAIQTNTLLKKVVRINNQWQNS